jgi:hypothetical protein
MQTGVQIVVHAQVAVFGPGFFQETQNTVWPRSTR